MNTFDSTKIKKASISFGTTKPKQHKIVESENKPGKVDVPKTKLTSLSKPSLPPIKKQLSKKPMSFAVHPKIKEYLSSIEGTNPSQLIHHFVVEAFGLNPETLEKI